MRAGAFSISPEVRAALAAGRAVVALESTIIAHGMPYPRNLETALAVEAAIRAAGAVPATLGVVAGEITVGLSGEQIRLLATHPEVMKAGERDLALAVAHGCHAATTAGASMAIAAAAGIRVFVTGGIGGVGPDAARDFDISADLAALASYKVVTVCAGAKAFMDVPATLEYLETLRVPVATWRAAEFPLFYARSSGCVSAWVVHEASELAAVFAARARLGLEGGILVGVPVPEAQALPPEITRAVIQAATEDVRRRGIAGPAFTPALLSATAERTGGRSLEANVALILNNARVGAEIARALERI
jgi:pseudouridine-5'-phosphate glycosidase